MGHTRTLGAFRAMNVHSRTDTGHDRTLGADGMPTVRSGPNRMRIARAGPTRRPARTPGATGPKDAAAGGPYKV
jgi:hypothetical protein